MKRYIYLKCLRGRMKNPFTTIRAIAEHVTRVHCRPDECGFWLYQSARRLLRADITEERFEAELQKMIREGILGYHPYYRYYRVDYGWHGAR